jgi:hypothetical protein
VKEKIELKELAADGRNEMEGGLSVLAIRRMAV